MPEYDAAFAEFVHESVRELARARDPILAQVRHETGRTSVASRVRARDGMDVDLPERSTAYEIAFPVDAVRAGDTEPLMVQLDAASETLAKDLVGMMFEHVSKITEATGNVVHADGPLTFETIFKMMESIEWFLDDDGNLSIPSLAMHPDAVRALPEATPEQLAMVEDLKRRKYEEALARRPRRRLS
jgi:hypothetical protein